MYCVRKEKTVSLRKGKEVVAMTVRQTIFV